MKMLRIAGRWGLVWALAWMAGDCSSEGPPPCTPGQQISCACLTGQGFQVCESTGKAYGACSCPAGNTGADAGPGDAGSAGSGDAGNVDAGCVAESDQSLCQSADVACGSYTGQDNCGATRTVDCGTCSDSGSGPTDAGADAGSVVDAGSTAIDAGADGGTLPDAGDGGMTGTGVAGASCTSNASCAPGFVCVNVLIESVCAQDCSTGQACPGGDVCCMIPSDGTEICSLSATCENPVVDAGTGDAGPDAGSADAGIGGAGLHIQLTWPQAFGDLDLHYIGPGGAIFDNGDYMSGGAPAYPNDGDIFWIYSQQSYCGTSDLGAQALGPAPEWGLNSTIQSNGTTVNDAAMIEDQQCGLGPEDITHVHPFDALYEVMVHEWCSGGTSTANRETMSSNGAPLTAVVTIYFNGNAIWSGQQSLTYNQYWDAATVAISASGTVATAVTASGAITTAPDTEGCAGGGAGGSVFFEQLLPVKHRPPGGR